MRKYDFTDHVALGMSEIADRIQHPVLKDGTVTVFKIADPGTNHESFRCAECLSRELFDGPSDLDPTGYFRSQVEQGNLNVIAVPNNDYDHRVHYCSGCDQDITNFTPGDYEDTSCPGDGGPLEPDLYEDGEGYSDRHGEEIEGDYNGEVMLQCPQCGNIDELESLFVGWCPVAADGQFSTDEMENTERMEGEDGGKTRCGHCGLMADTRAFEGAWKMFKIFERFERADGSYYFGGTDNYIFVSDDMSDMQIVGAVRAVRVQFKKSEPKIHHIAKRLTDKNIVIMSDKDGKILFDLRYDYEGEDDKPEENNGLVQCGTCGNIARDSKFAAGADGVPVCPRCADSGSAIDYKGQEGRLGNIAGRFKVREVVYKADNSPHVPVEKYGRLLPSTGDTLGHIFLVKNASAMYFINQLNALLRIKGKMPQGELRIVRDGCPDEALTFSVRVFDGSAAMFFVELDSE